MSSRFVIKISEFHKARSAQVGDKETLMSPHVDVREKHQIMEIQTAQESWMTPIKMYLPDNQLPSDVEEAK